LANLPSLVAPKVDDMKCPFCGVDNDKVIDSRSNSDGYSIRRRRECLACQRRFTTYELVEKTNIKVIKKDGGREPFNPEKIRSGLEKACWKRPVSDRQIRELIEVVEREVHDRYDSEVAADRIGELIMKHLKVVDQVAYVRFASVYRQFQDVHDFVEELQPMLRQPRPDPK
jgi:transcriptional repressor NrdR